MWRMTEITLLVAIALLAYVVTNNQSRIFELEKQVIHLAD